ncbi:MAG: hypothetical protein AAFR04_03775 [Pseudomonadota bacterium]
MTAAALTGSVAPLSPAWAAPAHNTTSVRADQVPGLAAFVGSQVNDNFRRYLKAMTALRVDLDVPADGAPEWLLPLTHPAICTHGCDTLVLRRQSDRSLQLIGRITALAPIVTGNTVNAHRVLRGTGPDQTRYWHFEAGTYKPSWTRKVATSKFSGGNAAAPGTPSTALNLTAIDNKQQLGSCHNGFLWHGGARPGGGGYATFRTCRGSLTALDVTCKAGTSALRLRPNVDLAAGRSGLQARQGQRPIPIVLQIDRTRFRFSARAEQLAPQVLRPVFTVQRGSKAFSALRRSNWAIMRVGRTRIVKLHLKGSAEALAAMLRACAG